MLSEYTIRWIQATYFIKIYRKLQTDKLNKEKRKTKSVFDQFKDNKWYFSEDKMF